MSVTLPTLYRHVTRHSIPTKDSQALKSKTRVKDGLKKEVLKRRRIHLQSGEIPSKRKQRRSLRSVILWFWGKENCRTDPKGY